MAGPCSWPRAGSGSKGYQEPPLPTHFASHPGELAGLIQSFTLCRLLAAAGPLHLDVIRSLLGAQGPGDGTAVADLNPCPQPRQASLCLILNRPCPTAAEGHENNWVQTVPGTGSSVLLLLYGPEKSWSDKTWKPAELA